MQRYIYIIGAGDGLYKVGLATDVVKRLKQLQTANPLVLRVFHQHLTFAPMRMEALIHSLLADCHVRGEWFRDLDAIYEAIAHAEEIRPRGHAASQARAWRELMRDTLTDR